MVYTFYLTVKETFLWNRILAAILCSIIFQCVFFSIFVFIVTFDIMQPLSSILTALNIAISVKSLVTLLPLFVIICAQCFVCSRQFFTVGNYVGTRFARLLHAFFPSNLVTTLLYILISAAIPITYQFPCDGDYGRLIRKCQSSERYICMNEGGVFLLLNGLWIGLFFSLQNYFYDSNIILFPVVQQRMFLHIKSGLNPILKQAITEAFWPTVYFFLLYYWQGAIIREFTASFLGVLVEASLYNTILELCNMKLIFYSWFFAVMFVITMNTMKLFLKITLMRHIKFPITSPYSSVSIFTLHQAITCLHIPIIQYLGYYDLRILSEKDAARRQELFSLSIPGGHPYNWNLIVEECLRLLKKYTQSLNEANGEKFAADQRNLSNVQPLVSHCLSTPLQNISLICSPQQCPSTNISQYSAAYPSPNMTHVLQSPVRKLETSYSEKQFIHTMSLLPQQSGLDIFKEYFNNYVEMLCKKPGISYLFSEVHDAKVRHHLREGPPIVWAMESLSILAAASYNEDKYGVVQKDLPAIITTLLQLKQTMDKLQKIGNYRRAQKVENHDLKMKAALRSSVRHALYRISITFRKHLKDLPLGKEAAQQMQNFVLYREV